MLKIAINGFGRIGRMALRAFCENRCEEIQIVCINDLGSLKDLLHLFKYDSVHGPFKGGVAAGIDSFDLGFGEIKVISEMNPNQLPWKEMGIDLVLECTGKFSKRSKAEAHIEAGAKRVIISTICDDDDITVVYGVNHQEISEQHKIISNASCTSNCLIPVCSTLHQSIGIVSGHMTSIHAYTNGQCLVDSHHQNLQRSRAVSISMIPSTTNAALAIGKLLPDLDGKVKCSAVRVPILNVSMIDFNFVASRDTTIEEINQAIKSAAQTNLNNIMGYNSEPLVSVDFNHDPRSAIVDIKQTDVTEKRLCRVVSWYDNEWGYANRLCDVANYLATQRRNKC